MNMFLSVFSVIALLNYSPSSFSATSSVSLSGASTGFITSPSSLSITHSSRSKSFTVSWTAGTGNGGSGGCSIQYLKSNSTWAAVASPSTVNCDAAGSAVGTVTLPGDGWYGASWSSVQVRLIRNSDNSVMGTLGSLSCTSTSGASSNTPSIDENCNNNWDDTTTQNVTIYHPSYQGGSTNYGSTITCPSLASVGATSNDYVQVFASAGGSGTMQHFSDNSCTTPCYSITTSSFFWQNISFTAGGSLTIPSTNSTWLFGSRTLNGSSTSCQTDAGIQSWVNGQCGSGGVGSIRLTQAVTSLLYHCRYYSNQTIYN